MKTSGNYMVDEQNNSDDSCHRCGQSPRRCECVNDELICNECENVPCLCKE